MDILKRYKELYKITAKWAQKYPKRGKNFWKGLKRLS
jgi:hypothetical protein